MLLLLSVGTAWAGSPRLQRAASLAAMITTSPINRYRIDCWTSTQAMLMLVEARDDSQAMVDRCRRVATPQRGLALCEGSRYRLMAGQNGGDAEG
jgi:hypothetical protein